VSETFELVDLTARERAIFDDGWTSGYCAGHVAGRRFAEDDMARLHREAVRVVRALAKLPERDRDEDRRRAARREARWSA
jgi:hypothetical protein